MSRKTTPKGLDTYYHKRLKLLVREGRLEAVGNQELMREPESRLPQS